MKMRVYASDPASLRDSTRSRWITSLVAGAVLTAGICTWDMIAPNGLTRLLTLPFGALALMANVHQPNPVIGFGSMFVFWTGLTYLVLMIVKNR